MSNEVVAHIPYSEIRTMAMDIHKAGMFGFKSPEQAMSLMLLAQAEGIHPMQAMRQFHILSDGKVSMRADCMLAKYRARGGKVEWLKRADDRDVQAGRWTFEGQTVDIGFTLEEAIHAGYTSATPKAGSGWQRDPAAMLRARTTSRAMRLLCPEVVVGLYTPEEMEDIPVVETAGRAPRGSKAAPDVQIPTVVSSTPASPAQATQAPAEAAPAVAADPDEPKDEAGRLKYNRGKFNQALLAVTNERDFLRVRQEFERAHGKGYMDKETGHKPGETFLSLMTAHWARVARLVGNAKWLIGVGTCFDEKSFRSFENAFINGDVDQSKENEAALNKKGAALKIPEYIGGTVSDSAAPMELEEDFNAQMERGA